MAKSNLRFRDHILYDFSERKRFLEFYRYRKYNDLNFVFSVCVIALAIALLSYFSKIAAFAGSIGSVFGILFAMRFEHSRYNRYLCRSDQQFYYEFYNDHFFYQVDRVNRVLRYSGIRSVYFYKDRCYLTYRDSDFHGYLVLFLTQRPFLVFLYEVCPNAKWHICG